MQSDDNYKNILQVLIQKEFKTTPVYREISLYHETEGYHMGVYLCLGQKPHYLNHKDSLPFSNFGSFDSIQDYIKIHSKIYVFLGESKHKIKKKAEQSACEKTIAEIGK